MARMIPEYFDEEETKSSAEKKLFRRFKAMPDTEEWTVLHSLNIAEHATQSQGEADFVVLIPKGGVLVLEVKGGRISHQNGQWFSKNRENIDNQIKNPINEANDAMHSLKDRFYSRLNPYLFGFGVVFPDISYHGLFNTVEISDEQVADCDDCLTPENLKKYLLRLSRYWKSKLPKDQLPDQVQCAELVKMMRPDYEAKVSLRSRVMNVENQQILLTNEQQKIVDSIVENERILVRGSAGTGKTVIATLFVRQKIKEGHRVGFFCYNLQLADYLKKNIGDDPNLVCDSFTRYMESIVRQAGSEPANLSNTPNKSHYYKEELPQLFQEAFIELENPLFDYLVLDEGQDLLTENYLEVMDLILKDGLQDGQWCFFVDSEKQNLFQREINESDRISLLKKFHAYYTRNRLTENCRNSVAIIEKIDSIFDLKTEHGLMDDRGSEVKVRSFRNMEDQKKLLEQTIQEIVSEGVTYDQIVILSPVRIDTSVASLIKSFPVSTDPEKRKGKILFSTIHRFKGLESPVVIMTDIVNIEDSEKKDLLYTGMTRAKAALYILAKERVAKQLR